MNVLLEYFGYKFNRILYINVQAHQLFELFTYPNTLSGQNLTGYKADFGPQYYSYNCYLQAYEIQNRTVLIECLITQQPPTFNNALCTI